jgi:hypothetical protein
MSQIHSYYITNIKSELKFSSSNLDENELESIIQEITTSMINNDNFFIEDEEEEEEIISDEESIKIEENDINDLLISTIMNLDHFERKDNENIEENLEENSSIETQSQFTNHENTSIDFETILNEEFS